jgi:tetratricopeptide (TPR) repeat protein
MRRGALALVLVAWSAIAEAAPPRFVDDGGPLLSPTKVTGGPFFYDEDPTPEAVRAEVQKRGLWTGAPLGIGACSGCHADVAAQWAQSAHRFSSFNNPYYRVSVEDFRKERGVPASRFCAGCHEPFALDKLSQLDRTMREAQSGLTCIVCHSIEEVGARHGNGEYRAVIGEIPLKAPAHNARVRRPLLATAELCGSCHKVSLTPEITHDHWLRGQNDYDAWHASAVSGHGVPSVWRPDATKRCQDCHMPLEPAPLGDLGAKNGMVRSHRFLAANSALPHLRADADAERRVREMLAGAVSVDLAWHDGSTLDVILRARRVGHRFPGGTMDSNEVWVIVEALDDRGRVIARSGGLEPDGAVPPDAHLVRAQPVDENGVPLLARDPQHMRGMAFDAALLPSDPSVVRYAIPAKAARVRAILVYRKFSVAYARRACADLPDAAMKARCLDLPVVEVARGEIARGETMPDDWKRLTDWGLGLAAALADCASEAEEPLLRAQKIAPDRPEPLLGLARLAQKLGRTDEAVRFAVEASKRAPAHPAAPWLAATSLEKAYRQREARPFVERLLGLVPDDRFALALAARVRGVVGDARGALAAAEGLLAVDPELDEGWYQRALALRELRRVREAEASEERYLYHRVTTEVDLALRDRLRAARAGVRLEELDGAPLPDESVPVHTHLLRPVPTRPTKDPI